MKKAERLTKLRKHVISCRCLLTNLFKSPSASKGNGKSKSKKLLADVLRSIASQRPKTNVSSRVGAALYSLTEFCFSDSPRDVMPCFRHIFFWCRSESTSCSGSCELLRDAELSGRCSKASRHCVPYVRGAMIVNFAGLSYPS